MGKNQTTSIFVITLILCFITSSIASQLRKHEELSAHAAHNHSGLRNLSRHFAEHHNMSIADAREFAATHNGSIAEHIRAHHEHAEHEHAEEEADHDEAEEYEEGKDMPAPAEPTEFVQKHNHTRLRNLSRHLARHHNMTIAEAREHAATHNGSIAEHIRAHHEHAEHEHAEHEHAEHAEEKEHDEAEEYEE